MSFRYVQRLNAAPDGRAVNAFGSDPMVSAMLLEAGAKIDLDYMGSSEFEHGMARVSGNRIANSANDLKIVTQTLVRPEYQEDVHFLCTDDQVDAILPIWHDWTQHPQSKEALAYFKDDKMDMNMVANSETVVGWWAMDEDLIWSREAEVAESIRSAFVVIANRETV